MIRPSATVRRLSTLAHLCIEKQLKAVELTVDGYKELYNLPKGDILCQHVLTSYVRILDIFILCSHSAAQLLHVTTSHTEKIAELIYRYF